MIDILTFFFQLTSWLGIPFAMWGVVALWVEVIPRQLRERRIQDDIVKTRKRLPILVIIFASLASIAVANIANNIIIGRNEADLLNNLMRTVVLGMVFIKCLTWKLIYTDEPEELPVVKK